MSELDDVKNALNTARDNLSTSQASVESVKTFAEKAEAFTVLGLIDLELIG